MAILRKTFLRTGIVFILNRRFHLSCNKKMGLIQHNNEKPSWLFKFIFRNTYTVFYLPYTHIDDTNIHRHIDMDMHMNHSLPQDGLLFTKINQYVWYFQNEQNKNSDLTGETDYTAAQRWVRQYHQSYSWETRIFLQSWIKSC